MTIYRNFDHIDGEYTACIGFFDGVHRGHQFLLQHVKEEAKRGLNQYSKEGLPGEDAVALQSAVVTFVNHPRQVVDPAFEMHLIDTLEVRLEKLGKMGIDACFLIEFTEEVRRMTACQFIQDFLRARLHVRRLIIGYDHRFGRDRSEGFEDYVRYGAECGMQVIQAPVFDDGSGLHYSSSEVRRALQAGDKEKARQLLGW